MTGLESQEENSHRGNLWFKTMSWLGQIRTYHRDETWSASLCQTFFATFVGSHIPLLPEIPLSTCGFRKFQIDSFGDHLCSCTSHSGVKKTHDWVTDQISDLFRTTNKVTVKTKQVTKNRGKWCGLRCENRPPDDFFLKGKKFIF